MSDFKVTIKDTGIDKELIKFGLEIEKSKFKALKKGAESFAVDIERTTPVGPYRSPEKYGPGTSDYSPVHMKDNVKYQKRNTGYVVGYGKETAWRAPFINNGTVKLSPTFFFDKAVEANLGSTYTIIERELRKEMFK